MSGKKTYHLNNFNFCVNP
jgi:hypothetical protein